MYRVYIKVDENNKITAINSNAFIKDLTGWIQIDSGEDLKHLHAQNNYLSKPTLNDYGVPNFLFKDGNIEEVPEEEVKAEIENVVAKIAPSYEERFKKIESAINNLLKLFGKEV